MAEISPSAGVEQRRLVFQVGDHRHEIDGRLVLEVIRAPHITRVPHGPEALAGIANLRGRPVPVLAMSRVLGADEKSPRRDGKIIVYDNGSAVGLLVDDVLGLSADAQATRLTGLHEILDAAFRTVGRAPVQRPAEVPAEADASVKRRAFLAFRVSGQLYGLPLDDVREVATLTSDVAAIPNAGAEIIGLLPMRDRVLPLVSLAALVGLDAGHVLGEKTRIVVVENEGDLIGLVVDEMDVIHRLPEHAIDPVPAVLQRGRGEAQIEAIGRIADGGLLISILSPEKLFGHQAVSRAVGQNMGARPMETTPERQDGLEKFLVFQLGDENYGLPIAAVDEVVRVPSDVTRVPGAPGFVTGIINLRGKAISLIDQRTRFDAPVATPTTRAETTKARAIIVTLGSLQAGFVVDSVSEVKAIPAAALSSAPEFSSDQTDVFDRVAHIEADGRMLLLIDPQQLLTRAERDVVAAIARQKPAVASL